MRINLRLLVAGDALLAFVAFYSAILIRLGVYDVTNELMTRPLERSGIFVSFVLVLSYIFEVYNLEHHHSKSQIGASIAVSTFFSFSACSVVFYLLPNVEMGRGLLVISVLLLGISQYFWHVYFVEVFCPQFLQQTVLVLGTGTLAKRVGDLFLLSSLSIDCRLAGFISITSQDQNVSIDRSQIVCNETNFFEAAVCENISAVIVAAHGLEVDTPLQMALLNCKLNGVEVVHASTFYERVTGKLMLESMNNITMIYSTGFRMSALISAIKRIVDIVLSLIGILLTLPLAPFIALLVKLDSPGPILYSQIRTGYLGNDFVLYKFRTMKVNAEEDSGPAWSRKNDPRIRPLGCFLRKTRLDELPQLFNVLKGDMSFVGPRPERPEFVCQLDQQIPFYGKRHLIKPGITGWAQVRYPYGASVEDAYEKLCYDLYYFKNMSPILDTIIVLKTIRVMLFQQGGR